MAQPPSESPTLGHDPAYPAESHASSTPLDTVSVTDADLSPECRPRREEIREAFQQLRVSRQLLLRERAERWLRHGTEIGRARTAEEIRRLEDEIMHLLLRLFVYHGVQPGPELGISPVLWWSGRGEPQGCCVRLLTFHDSPIPIPEYLQLESPNYPRVCISVHRPPGRWELDRAYLWPRVIARGRSYLLSFSITPGLPLFIRSSQMIVARPDNRS